MSLRYARLRDEELAARAAGESAYHLRANCSAEEQTRVMLLEQQVPLENEKSRLEEQLLRAELGVAQAKEAKRSINDEIERLNSDLFDEAHKLVAEELREKDALKIKEAIIMDEFERLKSQLMLEKDRYTLAAALVKEVCDTTGHSFSIDEEMAADLLAASPPLRPERTLSQPSPVRSRVSSM